MEVTPLTLCHKWLVAEHLFLIMPVVTLIVAIVVWLLLVQLDSLSDASKSTHKHRFQKRIDQSDSAMKNTFLCTSIFFTNDNGKEDHAFFNINLESFWDSDSYADTLFSEMESTPVFDKIAGSKSYFEQLFLLMTQGIDGKNLGISDLSCSNIPFGYKVNIFVASGETSSDKEDVTFA